MTVAPETEIGKPAIWVARRPILSPCSASGKEQPIITSSISLGSMAAGFIDGRIHDEGEQILGAGILQGPPCRAGSREFLTDVTIYASLIVSPPLFLIAQRLAGGQHMLDTGHGFSLVSRNRETLSRSRVEDYIFVPRRC